MNRKNGSGFRLPRGFSRTSKTGYVVDENPDGCSWPWKGYFSDPFYAHFATEWATSGLSIVGPGQIGNNGYAYVTCPAMPSPIHHQLVYLNITNAGGFAGGPSTGPGPLVYAYQDPITHDFTAYWLMISNSFSIPPASGSALGTIPRMHIVKYVAAGPTLTVLAEVPVPDLPAPFIGAFAAFESHIVPVGGTNAGMLKLEGRCESSVVTYYLDPATALNPGSFGVGCFGGAQAVGRFLGYTYPDGTDGILDTDF